MKKYISCTATVCSSSQPHFAQCFLPYQYIIHATSSSHHPAPRDLDDRLIDHLSVAINNPSPPPHTKRDKPFRPRLLLLASAAAHETKRDEKQIKSASRNQSGRYMIPCSKTPAHHRVDSHGDTTQVKRITRAHQRYDWHFLLSTISMFKMMSFPHIHRQGRKRVSNGADRFGNGAACLDACLEEEGRRNVSISSSSTTGWSRALSDAPRA
jgi:hypothetical protein